MFNECAWLMDAICEIILKKGEWKKNKYKIKIIHCKVQSGIVSFIMTGPLSDDCGDGE